MGAENKSFIKETAVTVVKYGALIGGLLFLLNGSFSGAIVGGAVALVAHVVGKS